MTVSKLEDHIYLIDAETAGIEGFIASYVLLGGKHVAMVETGPSSSVPNLLLALREIGVKFEDVSYVAVSHIHLDHGGGVGALLKSLPNAKVIVHQRGAPHLADPSKLWAQSRMVLGEAITGLYGAPEAVPEGRIIAASDGMAFDLGDDVALNVVETLGHASHHLSYFEPGNLGLFPGDAAGIYLAEIGVVVPTTPAPFRLDTALASLGRLMSLKPDCLFYSHFGKSADAVERLSAYQGQLGLWARLAKEGIDRGEGPADVREKILAFDPAVKRALDYVQIHPILGETVLNNSVQGVYDFVKSSGFVP